MPVARHPVNTGVSVMCVEVSELVRRARQKMEAEATATAAAAHSETVKRQQRWQQKGFLSNVVDTSTSLNSNPEVVFATTTNTPSSTTAAAATATTTTANSNIFFVKGNPRNNPGLPPISPADPTILEEVLRNPGPTLSAALASPPSRPTSALSCSTEFRVVPPPVKPHLASCRASRLAQVYNAKARAAAKSPGSTTTTPCSQRSRKSTRMNDDGHDSCAGSPGSPARAGVSRRYKHSLASHSMAASSAFTVTPSISVDRRKGRGGKGEGQVVNHYSSPPSNLSPAGCSGRHNAENQREDASVSRSGGGKNSKKVGGFEESFLINASDEGKDMKSEESAPSLSPLAVDVVDGVLSRLKEYNGASMRKWYLRSSPAAAGADACPVLQITGPADAADEGGAAVTGVHVGAVTNWMRQPVAAVIAPVQKLPYSSKSSTVGNVVSQQRQSNPHKSPLMGGTYEEVEKTMDTTGTPAAQQQQQHHWTSGPPPVSTSKSRRPFRDRLAEEMGVGARCDEWMTLKRREAQLNRTLIAKPMLPPRTAVATLGIVSSDAGALPAFKRAHGAAKVQLQDTMPRCVPAAFRQIDANASLPPQTRRPKRR